MKSRSKINLWHRFWLWYERNLTFNTVLATGLFLLQLVHLFWLTTDVVLFKLFGHSFFPVSDLMQLLIVVVDYTEMPALITTTLVYLHELRYKRNFHSFLFLFLINSQWLHLFWITDEFVVETFRYSHQSILPIWLAWFAIIIDYFELPVIFDTIKRSFKLLMGNYKEDTLPLR